MKSDFGRKYNQEKSLSFLKSKRDNSENGSRSRTPENRGATMYEKDALGFETEISKKIKFPSPIPDP